MTKSSYWIPDCHFWQLSPAWCRQRAMWSGGLRCLTGALLTGVLCSGSKERSSINNSCTTFPTQAKALCSMYCWKALSPAAKVPLTLGRRGRRWPHTLYTSPSQYRSQHTHGNGRSTLFQKVLHTTSSHPLPFSAQEGCIPSEEWLFASAWLWCCFLPALLFKTTKAAS